MTLSEVNGNLSQPQGWSKLIAQCGLIGECSPVYWRCNRPLTPLAWDKKKGLHSHVDPAGFLREIGCLPVTVSFAVQQNCRL